MSSLSTLWVRGWSRQLLQTAVTTRSRVRLKATTSSSDLVLSSTRNNVTTITLNDPGGFSSLSPHLRSHTSHLCFTGKYNAWSKSLCDQMITHFARAAADADTKVKSLSIAVLHSGSFIIFPLRLSSTQGPTPTSVLEAVSPNYSLRSHHQSILFIVGKTDIKTLV